MDEQERAQRRDAFASALRALLVRRGIAPTGGALARVLSRTGIHINAANLQKLLDAKTMPKPTTVAQLIKGLNLSEVERVALSAVHRKQDGRSDPTIVSVVGALEETGAINRGRNREEVTWEYTIGSSNEEDSCREIRITECGPEGLQVANVAPGQIGAPGFNLLDLPKLQMEVTAVHWPSGSKAMAVQTSLQVVEIEPGSSRFRTIVQFWPPLVNEKLGWVLSYRWPGLWRSLRETGQSKGRLKHGGSPEVTIARVVLIAKEAHLPSMSLKPGQPIGEVTAERRDGNVVVTWRIERPPKEIGFEVCR